MPRPLEFTAAVEWCEITAADAAAEKKLRRFAMKAYTGGAMPLPNFYRPVVIDLAGMKAGAKSIPIFRGHDPDKIVGHADEIEITDREIKVAGVISADNEHSREIAASSDNGFPWQASVGAEPTAEFEYIAEGVKATVNGQTISGPCLIARKSILKEVSFVPLGADRRTFAKVAASAKQEGKIMEFEKWLEAQGFVAANLDEKQTASLKAAWEKTKTPEPPKVEPVDPTAEIRAKAAAEAKRIGRINDLTAKAGPLKCVEVGHENELIAARAIEAGWDENRVELEILRASRPKSPAIHTQVDVADGQVIEAAIAQAGKLPNLEKHFEAKTLDAAHKQFKGRIGLQQMLIEAAWAGGFTGRHFECSQTMLRAAFSSLSLPGILSNNVNKFLLEAFMAVEQTWRAISRIRPVNDFKTITSYRMNGNMEYEEVGPSGELKHGTLGESSFTNRAKTYGKMFSITRENIINDDLGALTDVPRMIGRGAALKLNTVFWTRFLNDSAFFTSGNANYISGAGTVLSIDQLTALELLFLNQVDADSKPMAIAPAILLVPNALSTTASVLMAGLELRDTTASTKIPTKNPHSGKFRVERSSYLSNSAISGYSTTAWYLLANPMDEATMEVAFLNGHENPTVETAEADFNTLGIQMRGYHDFGCALREYRAGAKSKGAA